MIIRPASLDDAAAIAAIYAPYVSDTVISFETVPPSADEMAGRIETCLVRYPWLVADDGGRIAGYVYAGRHAGRAAYDWSADVTAYLHPDYHRQGLATRLYRVLISLLKRQGYHALFAGITLPNAASVGLHRSFAMEEVGVYRQVGFKFGQWHDVLWMGMTISDGAAPENSPTPFPELDLEDRDFAP